MEPSTKEGHSLDLRLPLGGLLMFYGVVLLVYGMMTLHPIGSEWIYNKSLGINVNLIWGLLMFVVGAVLLGLSFFESRKLK